MRGPGAVLTIADVLFVRTVGAATVDERLEEVGAKASERLRPHFEEAGVSYPPAKVVVVGLEDERRLEIYAAEADGEFSFIREYPVLAASGSLGPKLRQGDRQVPEGVYTIDALNLADGVLDALPEWMDEVYAEVRAELDGLKYEGG